MSAALADRRLLRRAALSVALQTGAAVAVVVAVVVGLVYGVSLDERRDAAVAKAEGKIDLAGEMGVDLASPYPFVLSGLPAECSEEQVRDAARDLPDGTTWVTACGEPYVAVVGEDAGGVRLTAVVSFVEQQEETARLARLSVGVGALGVLVSLGLGWFAGRRAVRPLGHALAAQRRFVADASHELRTPVAILMTRAQLLGRGAVGDEDRPEELRQLVADARTLSDVVDDLLAVADLHHRPREPEPVDLAALAASVRDAYAGAADERDVDLVVDSVPAAASGSVVVQGVPTALRRAVAALVDNALAHSRPGGRVVLDVSADRRSVRLAVADDGEGLDPTTAADLVQRYQRGPDSGDAADRAGRLGLGLALVHEIVTAHRGRLEIDGSPGVGATFTLVLPRSDHVPAGQPDEHPRVRVPGG
ncbi:MAG: two-component sensor histidine kinase [Nocardioides sp.]|nr:two-component sensor histidine kinase [Nocardioides sp.]